MRSLFVAFLCLFLVINPGLYGGIIATPATYSLTQAQEARPPASLTGVWIPIFTLHDNDRVEVFEAWYNVYWRTLRWLWPQVKQVRVSMDSRSNVAQYVVFDAVRSTYINWFSASRIVESSYTDLSANTEYNYISIDGFVTRGMQRRFYISRNHGGCSADNGWFSVTDSEATVLCSWEKKTPKPEHVPRFMFCPGTTYCNWEKDGVIAEIFSIEIML